MEIVFPVLIESSERLLFLLLQWLWFRFWVSLSVFSSRFRRCISLLLIMTDADGSSGGGGSGVYRRVRVAAPV